MSVFLNLSPDFSVKTDEVIGIFDIESASLSPATRDFLRRKEREGGLISLSYDLPSSIVVTADKTYLSKYSASYLRARIS